MKPKGNKDHINNEYVEFIISSNLYDEPKKDGTQKLIKANIETKVSIYIHDIDGHEEIFNKNGKVVRSMCKIYHRNLGPLIVKSTYSNISKLKDYHRKDKQSNPIGFTYKNKK